MSEEQKPLLYPQVTPDASPQSENPSTTEKAPPPVLIVGSGEPTFFGKTPVHTVCPFCRNTIITNCEKRISSKTKLWAWICCLFGCCCLPICLDWFPEYLHKCPICESHVGTYPTAT